MIRYSNKNDIEQIKELLYSCFGEMVAGGGYERIESGRYLVYEEDGKIVALTGFCFDDEFRGIQITWTCTHPDYRHKGIMQKLFDRLLQTTDEDVYCSCWHIGDNDVNLHTLMQMYGFTRVVEHTESRDIQHNCPFPVDCPYRTDHCKCGNHLYLRKGQTQK